MGRSEDYKARRAEAEAARKKAAIPTPVTPDRPVIPPFHFKPRHARQEQVIALWPESTAMVITGPAGTGKTASAFAGAFADIVAGRARRVMVARPVIGVDEDLGYFPGGLDEKLLPWMGSVEDVWGKMSPAPLASIASLLEFRSVGLCRGRTVGGGTLIVDESQNCTLNQLVTILTRPDDSGRVVLCGDVDQCDLPPDRLVNGVCPLAHIVKKVQRAKVRRFNVVRFLPEDQQRSQFVRDFLAAIG